MNEGLIKLKKIVQCVNICFFAAFLINLYPCFDSQTKGLPDFKFT